MKRVTYHRNRPLVIILLVMALLLWGQLAWASGAEPSWRGTYDFAMKWLNFLILAFVIFKFTREPLRNFIQGQKDEVMLEIRSLEREKAAIQSEVQNAQQQLAESDLRLADLKEKIISRAEKEKELVIQAAQSQGQMMLESAKQRVTSRVNQARATLMADLVDMAATAAMSKLPEIITEADNEKYLNQFMNKVQALS